MHGPGLLPGEVEPVQQIEHAILAVAHAKAVVSVVWAAHCGRADSDEDEGPGEIRAGLLLCVILVV
jgi:hypothetical protein